tara:strand:- start:6248 stop:6535 length:288 start_codon:yes stop_codon:yes gene_type:complete
MIDTDKYKGHTPGPWWIENGFIMGNDPEDSVLVSETLEILEGNEADAQLATDAPLLLAEVKQLREAIADIVNGIGQVASDAFSHMVIEELRKVIE